MRPINGFFLFDLGQIWQLANLGQGVEIRLCLSLIGQCLFILKLFVQHPDNQNDLSSSVYEANELIKHLETIVQRPTEKITQQDQQIILHILARFRALLNDELGKIFTFVIEEKRGFNSTTLWKRPLRLFSSDVVAFLSDFIKINLDEAAKCLLLDRHTAVGFHSTRSAECAARKYYELVTGRKFDDSRFRTFGVIAQELKDKYDSLSKAGSPSGELGIVVSNLVALCKVIRNPLDHPEIIELNEDQAVDTLNQTITGISTMIRDAKTGGSHFVKLWTSNDVF